MVKPTRTKVGHLILETDNVREVVTGTRTVPRRPSLIGTANNVPISPDRSGTKIVVVAGVKQVRASQTHRCLMTPTPQQLYSFNVWCLRD